MTTEKASFIVNFEDGSRDIVKPVSWKNLDDVEILQTEILKIAVAEMDGHVGSAFRMSNVAFWDLLVKMGSLMPLVGKEEVGFDPRRIEDINHLIEIFITEAPMFSETTGGLIPNNANTLNPSLISKINSLNFQTLLTQVLTSPAKVAEKKARPSKRSSE